MRSRAFYLKIWLQEELAFLGDCPWEEDLSYVRAVCEQASVPLEVVPLQSEYQERVVSTALGRTQARPDAQPGYPLQPAHQVWAVLRED